MGQVSRYAEERGYVTDAEKPGGWTQCFDPEWDGYHFTTGVVNPWKRMPGKSWRDPNWAFPNLDGYPVVCVSWNDDRSFCKWLTDRERKAGRLPEGLEYRLPTEAEWEYACRAGSKTAYSFGDDATKLDDYAWFVENSKDEELNKPKATHKCGTKKPNAFGLCDMHGNVSEWCLDLHDPKYYEQCLSKKLELNPVNLPGAKKWGHVVRGGSFKDTPEKLRSAARVRSEIKWMYEDPQDPRSIWWLTRYSQIGFRICLPAEEYPELAALKPAVIKMSEHDEPREGK